MERIAFEEEISPGQRIKLVVWDEEAPITPEMLDSLKDFISHNHRRLASEKEHS